MRGKHVKIELNEINKNELLNFATTGKRNVKLVNRAKVILGLKMAIMTEV